MSLLVQTILIGIAALIVHLFAPEAAGWVIWGGFAIYAVGLLWKGLDDRRRLARGEAHIDSTSAAWLPAGMTGALIVLLIFLFYPFNKFHLLWAVNIPVLLVEGLGAMRYSKAEKALLARFDQAHKGKDE